MATVERGRQAIGWLILIVLVVLGSALATGTVALAMTALTPSSNISLPPCTTEDDPTDCYWDVTAHGGTGRSFVVLHGHIYYDSGLSSDR